MLVRPQRGTAAAAAPRRTPEKGPAMHQFRNDYSEGACPEVLDALVRTNAEQHPGYTDDDWCRRAADVIREEVGRPDAEVRFAPGGTAANILAVSGLCEAFEGPVCAADGHIVTHETGSIEATGRRVLYTADKNGVLTPEAAEEVWRTQTSQGIHMTRPGMVYFSDTTELGHVWTRAEFDAVCDWADSHGLPVYVDGARMASAMTAPGADRDIKHIAARAAAFTLGGTKAGLLFGEAMVVNHTGLAEKYGYLCKRTGALTAKGRLLGVQFAAALETGAYWRHARRANELACKLRDGLSAAGFEPYIDTCGNQQFFWTTADEGEAFATNLGCETFVDAGARRVMRFITSWATTEQDVDEAIGYARSLKGR